jgi:asparagine synthase (glutamine-hydrolysing)
VKALHQYDCLRANKATSAWGLEVRVPFLDKEFINVAMSMDPEWKMYNADLGRIEKWVMRKAFDDEEHPYLPKVEMAVLFCFFRCNGNFVRVLN